MRRFARSILSMTLASVLALAGCGDGEDATPEAPQDSPKAALKKAFASMRTGDKAGFIA